MLKRLILMSIIAQSAYSMITVKDKVLVMRKANPKDPNNKQALKEAREDWIVSNRKENLRKDNANAKKTANESFFLFKINQYEEKEINL